MIGKSYNAIFSIVLMTCASGAYGLDFHGPLGVVFEDSPSALFTGAPVGTEFVGDFNLDTGDSTISDGIRVVPFTAFFEDGSFFEFTNNFVVDTEAAEILNALDGPSFAVGEIVDLIEIFGDAPNAFPGGRIEVGLHYVLDPAALDDTSPDNYPPDPADLLTIVYSIDERDGQDDLFYEAFGVAQVDSDGDGVDDDADAFPHDPEETADSDGDGTGNNADPDDDNDGVPDESDEFPTGRFGDTPPVYWAYSFIETFAESGITSGCGGGDYCPDDSVTRAQMAVFLERGIHGSNFIPPPATGNTFLDVGASDFAAGFIEQFFLDGITGGCGGNNYCPNDDVTRAQMAVFLLRAKHGPGYLPPPAVGVFADTPLGSFAADWIEQLAAEGITGGCGGGNYCPGDLVTRAQMAVFIVRTFDL